MKSRLAVAALVAVSAGIAVAAVRQEEHGPAKPGKFHEFLKQFEGSWETKSEFKMGEQVMKSTGTEVSKFAVGGLFLVSDVKSDMDGMAFEAHSTWGYDVHKKKYTGSWVDNMSTAIWPFEGTVDEAGKVFSLVMEGPEPMSGKMIKIKFIHEVASKDARSMKLIMPGPDGKEMEMKIDFVRKK
jgi:hypothetical protein